MSDDVILQQSREILETKARSFRWAASFLSPERHDDVAVVYAFCRRVDDAVDDASTKQEARDAIAQIRAELDGTAPASPLIQAFLEVSARRDLDLRWADELITGVLLDVEEVIMFEDDVELLQYCYRVAGVVGLMMCSVLGVEDPEAHPYALDLGVGMQLTNICRDVAEDAGMGRVYLPRTRLAYHGTNPEALLDGSACRESVARVVQELLVMGDAYYESADAGMRFIPPRSRVAIMVASRLYHAIGVKLQRNGSDALAGRTIVDWKGKSQKVAEALATSMHPKITGLTPQEPHDPNLHVALSGLPGTNS